jgi:hypothetical protein
MKSINPSPHSYFPVPIYGKYLVSGAYLKNLEYGGQ